MKISLKKGFDPYWLTQAESTTKPSIVRTASNSIMFPAMITPEEREEEDPETHEKTIKVVYKYYPVQLPYRGDNIDDYVSVKLNRWSELREYFYGVPWAQSEMSAKGTWTLHAQAVRALFPKVAGELPEGLIKFHETFKNFWGLIAGTCKAYNIPLDVLPEYFDCNFMLGIATQYGITGDALIGLVVKFQFVVDDLIARQFCWINLFPKPSNEDLEELAMAASATSDSN